MGLQASVVIMGTVTSAKFRSVSCAYSLHYKC